MLSQTESHKELILDCQEHLQDLGINSYLNYYLEKSNRWRLTVSSQSLFIFSELRRLWYPNGIKIVPKDIQLTPKTIAYWFMGDGSCDWITSRISVIGLHTQGFDIESIKLLQQKLLKFDINSKLQKYSVGYAIRIGKSDSIRKFFDLTKGYILKSFNYKIKIPTCPTRSESCKLVPRGFCERDENNVQVYLTKVKQNSL